MGLIACHYRAAEWRHKEIELAAHELLQYLDRKSASRRGAAAPPGEASGSVPTRTVDRLESPAVAHLGLHSCRLCYLSCVRKILHMKERDAG